MFGKFEEPELAPYIFKETLNINRMKFELTLYRRDKNSRSPVPIWVHNVKGGNYVIHATPYLNGSPALQLSVNYIEDQTQYDERDISDREHDIGYAVSREPIQTFEEYKRVVRILTECIFDDYVKMIKKQLRELDNQ